MQTGRKKPFNIYLSLSVLSSSSLVLSLEFSVYFTGQVDKTTSEHKGTLPHAHLSSNLCNNLLEFSSI